MARETEIFLRCLTFLGLPLLAASALLIWKPVGPGDRPRLPMAARILAPLAVLLALLTPIVGVPVLGLAAWLLPRRSEVRRTLGDRVGWTIFAAGIALMLTMNLFASLMESDGDWRPFATIRLHSRIFLGFAALALAGPLGAWLFGRGARTKKPAAGDPLA